MAVKTKDEILASIREHFAEDSSDEAISFIEDVTDTFTDLESRANVDGTDWKAEATRIDNEWREKYKARFFSGSKEDEDAPDPEFDEPKQLKFEDLFKEG